jgi:hypothetical protein
MVMKEGLVNFNTTFPNSKFHLFSLSYGPKELPSSHLSLNPVLAIDWTPVSGSANRSFKSHSSPAACSIYGFLKPPLHIYPE